MKFEDLKYGGPRFEDLVKDIFSNMVDGDSCPNCKGRLSRIKGNYEVERFFQYEMIFTNEVLWGVMRLEKEKQKEEEEE